MFHPENVNGDLSYRANIYMAAFLIAAYMVLWGFDREFFFFWDTVENASILAHSYYENGFQLNVFLSDIHQGRFPLFGLYLSGLWQLIGRTLEISHLAIVPFLIVNAWMVWRIGMKHFTFYGGMLFVIMMLIQPTYLSHSIMVSPMIIILSGFLAVIYGILSGRRWLVWLASFILLISNDMGYLYFTSIIVWMLLRFIIYQDVKRVKKMLLPLVVMGLLGVLFWAFYSAQYDFRQMIFWKFNTISELFSALLGRFLEYHFKLINFGMFIFYIMTIILFIMKRPNDRADFRYWLLLFCSTYGMGLLHALFLDEVGSHGFYLPVHFSIMGLYLSMVYDRIEIRQFGWNVVVVLLVILSGSFWIYPVEYNQEWSGNISHIPYYNVREKMNQHLCKQEIPFKEIGTAFPNDYSTYYIDLDSVARDMHKYDMQRSTYILYSNVFNSFSAAERMRLQDTTAFTLLHEESLTNIEMKLYKNKQKE